MKTLLAALRDGDELGKQLCELLQSPWCWPADPAIAAGLLGRGFAAPVPPVVGECALLSVSCEAPRFDALWRLTDGQPPGARAFVGCARAALMLAQRLTVRELPLLPNPRALLVRPAWQAVPVARHTPEGAPGGWPKSLEGDSYGLPFCLAEASRLLELPLPPTLAATGVVDEDGCVGPVELRGLEQKAELVAVYALGVKELLVPLGGLAAAQAGAARGGREFDITEVDDLGSAFARAFGDLESRLRARWSTAGAATAAAQALYRHTLAGHPAMLRWGATARTAELLATRLRELGLLVVAEQVEFARGIALRHAGQPRLLPWPDPEPAWLRERPRPERFAAYAHIVQSAADSDDACAAVDVRRARLELRERRERSREDLELLGATGRALAATGAYAEAAEALRECVEDWLAMDAAPSASHSLCELLRVVGLLGQAEVLRELLGSAHRALVDDPRTSEPSRAYAALAAGRALVQSGDPEAGLRWLSEGGEVSWALAPDEVRESSARWRALALSALGRAPEADACRQELRRGAAEGTTRTSAPLLADLDRLLERRAADAELSAAMERLARSDGYEVERLAARTAPGASAYERAAFVAKHWRS